MSVSVRVIVSSHTRFVCVCGRVCVYRYVCVHVCVHVCACVYCITEFGL
jgi:hypothetical protein